MRKSKHPSLTDQRPWHRGKPTAPAQSVREHPFPKSLESVHFLYRSDRELKTHSSYKAAKAGSGKAAVQLISDLAPPLIAELLVKGFPRPCIFVAPHAREATGDNAIPQMLAVYLHSELGGVIDKSIVQVTRVFHTGADPMERMNSRAEFTGYVEPGAHYVLVDDVTTMGGTLAELANYIQARRAEVVGVVVLVNAGRSGRLVAPSKTILELERRYGNEIREIFGIATNALTADEAGYLIGFRSVDEIRGRLTKAREETTHRLGSKGIQLDEPQEQVDRRRSERRKRYKVRKWVSRIKHKPGK
ncbi:Conjugal transfer protein TraN [Cupriavidus oxalaticus]|uniref:phosphoribosyltransferase n=1 Tax=Cupriavidus oxalaticus TaxID=96344 RepID=UPI003F736929